MKKVLILFVLLLPARQVIAQCGGGELYFQLEPRTSGYTFDMEIKSEGYIWDWDREKSEPYPVPAIDQQYTGLVCNAFSAPKTGASAGQNIYWGLYRVHLTVKKNGVRQDDYTFWIDLTDENWSLSVSPYPGADTYFKIDPNDGGLAEENTERTFIYLEADQNGYTNSIKVKKGSGYNVWTLWGVSSPLQSNFTYPVQLMNREEGGTTGFGYLNGRGGQITSDGFDYYKKDVAGSVTHGTTEINNNVRKYSFRWENREIDNTISSIYNSKNDFKITAGDIRDRQIIRYFRTVYPLTVASVQMSEL